MKSQGLVRKREGSFNAFQTGAKIYFSKEIFWGGCTLILSTGFHFVLISTITLKHEPQ